MARWHRAALVAAVGLGIVMRCWEFGSPRALWLDEEYIAIVIRRGSFGSLVGFLPLIQSAPVGWLWLEKVLMYFSVDDKVLRAPTLVVSCLGLVASALLAKRLFRLPGQFAMVLMVGIVPTMAYYSAIMKPYGSDAAVTTILLWLTVRALQDGKQASFWYTAAGFVWYSQTAVFVVATSGAVLLWCTLRNRTWRGVRTSMAVAAVSAAVLYVVHVKPNTDQPLMPWWWFHFVPQSMAPQPLRASAFLDWLLDTSLQNIILIMPAQGQPQAVVMLLLLVAGGRMLWRRDKAVALTVLGPVLVAYTLAILHMYPLWERVLMWLVPALLLLLCVVVDEATKAALLIIRDPERLWLQVPAYLAGLMAVVVIIGHGYTGPSLRTDEGWPLSRFGHIREAFRYMMQHKQPGDRIYIHRYSVAAATWYGPRDGLQWDGQYDFAGTQAGFPVDAPPLTDPPPGATWWLLSGIGAEGPVLVDQRAELDRRGDVVDDRNFGYVRVMAYRADPVPPAGKPVILLRMADKQMYQEPMSAYVTN